MKFEEMINTIQLGSCYDLIKDIPDKSIDLVYIDIPYLYEMGGAGQSELSKRKHINKLDLQGAETKYLKEKNISVKELYRIEKNMAKAYNDYQNITNGIDYSIFDELCRIMKGIYIYIWCSKLQILDIMKYFIEKKNCNFEILTWNKTNPIPTANGTYLSDIEYCLFFKEKGTPKLNDGYELKSKWYVSQINQSDKELFKHPTIKPLELVKRHILHSTQENDIVLDCFCGSGTTCVACKETGRRYIGMEIDKEYWKIANNRINGIEASGQMTIMFDDKGNVMLGDDINE